MSGRRGLLIAVLTVIVFACAATFVIGSRGESTGQAVQFDVEVTPSVTLNEPVVLRYRISNGSGEPVTASLGFDRVGSFDFDLVGPAGNRQVARPAARDGGSRTPRVTIAPMDTYGQSAVLDEWLKFDAVGGYLLRVRFSGSMRGTSGPTMIASRDREFRVEVRPRDERRLMARCAELASRLGLIGTVAKQEAVNELAHIRDPVAIPFLEAGIERMASEKFCDTLAEIGGDTARRVLERLARSRDEMVAGCAATALRRLK
jgi:hypothetical protein